jgi:CubicO group peptidase (beta-lactamase class C family)
MRRTLIGWCIFPAVLLAVLPLLGREPASAEKVPAGQERLRGLDDFIAETMKEWRVPGLALAVVKDGEVFLVRGYGHRDRERQLPVTPRTLFAIASLTKSFTVTGLGMLADEKKLDWDRPVRDYLPDFRLHERIPGDRVTARDLVTHRTGLPRHDALWYVTKLSRRELYDRLHYLEPTKDLRYAYQYNNLAYLTAGVLLERVSGRTWEDFIRQRLFGPLGMTRANFSVSDSARAEDAALPCEDRGEVRRVPFRNIDAMAPAGGINASAEEMARYLQFHVNRGKHANRQLLSQAVSEEMQAPQMVIPLKVQKHDLFHEPGDSTYGMGFVVTRHRGQRMLQHAGSLDGFIALLSFLPEKKMGVVALSNLWSQDFNPVPTIVTREIYDRLLGETGTDWRERGREQCRKVRRLREEEKEKSANARKPGTAPSHPLSELAGTYEHPAYGRLVVGLDGKGLVLAFTGGTVLARHYHYDTFEIVDSPEHPAAMLEDNKLTFHHGEGGKIDRVGIEMQEGVADFTFHRLADGAK